MEKRKVLLFITAMQAIVGNDWADLKSVAIEINQQQRNIVWENYKSKTHVY